MANAVAAGWALSYVNRVDGRIHLSVHLPNFGVADAAGARVKVVKKSRSAIAPATIEQRNGKAFLEATLPDQPFDNGLWELMISPRSGARFTEAVARICVCDPNPIALLVLPSVVSYVPKPKHTLPRRQRVARRLGQVADAALAELPPGPAKKARAAIRVAARKVLPS